MNLLPSGRQSPQRSRSLPFAKFILDFVYTLLPLRESVQSYFIVDSRRNKILYPYYASMQMFSLQTN